jgi:pyrimidine-specific ribonucleoside hydrolase
MAVPVILDVDTGVDDALAILVALRSPTLHVRAITCVAGNVGVDQVLANTLKVLDAAGAPDIPVARGAARPSTGTAPPLRGLHGADGLADLGLPPSTRRAAAVSAVELLRAHLATTTSRVTLLALGPLCSVAALLRRCPDARDALERIVVIGGGDHQPEADFNFGYDPPATSAVLAAGVPTTAYSLDVFTAVTVPVVEARALAEREEPAARLAGALLLHQAHRSGLSSACVGDAGAVASVLEPGGLRTERRAGVDVAIDVDAKRYSELVLRALS